MPTPDFDEDFARHLRHSGLVTPEQLAQARKAGGPLAEALTKLGVLTAAQRDALVRKVSEQREGLKKIGPYSIVRKLGQGGMGAVYLANGPKGEVVAVKVLSRERAANEDARRRFRREAEAALKLRHPHLVRALGSGEDHELLYYVMEYVEGGTLDVLLSRAEPLPLERALSITLQAARGLEYLHQQGYIHRDVKPANILLSKEGVAQILDLGLTKDLGAEGSLRTVTGAVMGTPHYMSPEQARGAKEIDARGDIYSLGATLYHLLTHRLPFEGTTVLEILAKHVNQKLPDPREFRSELPEGLIQVLRRMMAKEPAYRYGDAAALIADLEEVAAGRPPKTAHIEAELSTLAQRRIDIPRPKRRSLMGAAVAAAAAIIAVTVWALSRPSPPPPPAPAPAVEAPKREAWIELLPRIAFSQDIRVGGWVPLGEELVADGTMDAGCQVPYAPSNAYDVILEFTREKVGCETGLFVVWRDQKRVLIALGGNGGNDSAIRDVNGKSFDGNPTRRQGSLLPNRRYRVEVQVRLELIRVVVDGEEWCRWTPERGPLSSPNLAFAPSSLILGLSNCKTRTVFHRLAVREIDGPGRFGR